MPQYLLREFKVTDARDGQSRTIRQFQFTDWPEQGVPKSGEGFIDFIGQVHKTKEQFGQEGPITVHCRYNILNMKMDKYSFCNQPLDYIYKRSLTEDNILNKKD